MPKDNNPHDARGDRFRRFGDDPSTSLPPSPVPTDGRLWPFELPFTAFGQFGTDALDLRVFDQDIYWVDRTGAAHLLDEMSATYLDNVIAFLRAHRETFFSGSKRRAFIQELGDLLLFGEPNGDTLAAAMGGPTWAQLTPDQWLESTPLMRALRRLASLNSDQP